MVGQRQESKACNNIVEQYLCNLCCIVCVRHLLCSDGQMCCDWRGRRNQRGRRRAAGAMGRERQVRWRWGSCGRRRAAGAIALGQLPLAPYRTCRTSSASSTTHNLRHSREDRIAGRMSSHSEITRALALVNFLQCCSTTTSADTPYRYETRCALLRRNAHKMRT